MRLTVTVKSGAKSATIEIPVGNGQRTFKWLALASAQHLMLQAPANKRSLRLVDANELISHERLLPKNIYSDKTCFFHPDDLICDHLCDGDDICVELYSSSYDAIPLDKYDRPVLSTWSKIAFNMSEKHQQERENLIQEKITELKMLRKKREEEALQRQLDWERPRLAAITTILKDQLVDEKSVESSAKRDWGLVVNSGILDNSVKEESERANILEFIVRHYVSLTELFAHFCAINAGAGSDADHQLEFIEFSKFIFDTDIFQQRHSAIMQKLFVESSIATRGSGKSGIEVELSFVEFLLSLVKIASYKFIALKRREQSMLRRKGQLTAISHASTPTPSEALQMLYNQNLRPAIENIAVAQVKISIGTKESLLLFYEHLDDMKRMYIEFQSDDDSMDSVVGSASVGDDAGNLTPSGTMSANEFLMFAQSLESFEEQNIDLESCADNNDDGTTTNEGKASMIRSAYMASQSSELFDATRGKIVRGAKPHRTSKQQKGISFAQFIESIARLGVMKYTPTISSMESADKTHGCVRCIQKILELVSKSVDSFSTSSSSSTNDDLLMIY